MRSETGRPSRRRSDSGRRVTRCRLIPRSRHRRPMLGIDQRVFVPGERTKCKANPRKGVEQMATIEESIEVDVPVTTAYNQWTQFEQFPQFMEGVDSVRQLDNAHLHWVVSHKGQQHEFDTELSEQRP